MSDDSDDLFKPDTLKALSDPLRRRIFEHLFAARLPKSRDEVAAELGVTRPQAAFHLDRLAEAGLIDVTFSRPPGRGGPGAGRPAKRYEARREMVGSLPPRHYRRLAEILAASIAQESDNEIWNSVSRKAFEVGSAWGSACAESAIKWDEVETVAVALDGLGYMSDREPSDGLVLRNCPFRAVAQDYPEVVCALNERFVAGIVGGLEMRQQLRVAGNGESPNCCVTITQR